MVPMHAPQILLYVSLHLPVDVVGFGVCNDLLRLSFLFSRSLFLCGRQVTSVTGSLVLLLQQLWCHSFCRCLLPSLLFRLLLLRVLGLELLVLFAVLRNTLR